MGLTPAPKIACSGGRVMFLKGCESRPEPLFRRPLPLSGLPCPQMLSSFSTVLDALHKNTTDTGPIEREAESGAQAKTE